MLLAILILTIMGIVLGYLLGIANEKFSVDVDPLEQAIEASLPGTQCGQCGFAGCRQAAAALVSGNAPVTLCPPGGMMVARELAVLLEVSLEEDTLQQPVVAKVQEAMCIGCTRCMTACPTDALVGAAKQLHVVFDEACTGCGACVDICPTECISLSTPPVTLNTWVWGHPDLVNQKRVG